MTEPTPSDWGRLDGTVREQQVNLQELRARMDDFESALRDNTEATTATKNLLAVNTRATTESKALLDEISGWGSELRDWMIATRKGLQVLGWLGQGAKWAAGLVAAGWTAYEAWRRFKG